MTEERFPPGRCTFVYSPEYYCDIGRRVFPTMKCRLVHHALLDDGDIPAERFLAPAAASREDLLLVHTDEYVRDLLAFRRSVRTRSSELPINGPIVRANLLGTGGTILCCCRALSEGLAMNLAGGFHHAFPDHAEGFCYINDIAVAIRRLRADGRAERVAVVDLDAHQGNGTAFTFRSDPSVFTFSMHQENNYPVKQLGTLDVALQDGVGDAEYLRLLDAHLPGLLDAFRPELVVYLAGADPLQGDQLGGLDLTLDGLRQRDERVIGNCLRRRIPVAAVLGGDYARNTQDTVRAHHATCRAMWEAGKQIANCRHPRPSPAPGRSPLWRAEKTGRRRIAE